MNIDPNNPNVDTTITTPPDIPVSTGDSSGTTTSPVDTISTASGSTFKAPVDFLHLDRPITIMDYARAVLDTIDQFRQEIYAVEQVEAAKMKQFHLAIAATCSTLAELYNQLQNLSSSWQTLVAKQNTENTAENAAITNYNQGVKNTEPQNGSDQQAIDQINWAIEQYNNGDIDEATFQSYVDDFNDYAEARNVSLGPINNAFNQQTSAYNSQAAVNNTEIQRLNDLFTLIGQDTIPLQEPIPLGYTFPVLSPPYETPIQSVPNMSSPQTMAPIPTPPTVDYIANYWQPLLESILPGLQEFLRKLALTEAFADLQKYYFKGGVVVLPDAFVQYAPNLPVAGTAGNHSLVGVDLSVLALGLSSQYLEAVLSLNLLKESIKDFTFPVSGDLNTLMRFFTIEWLVQQGLVAGLHGLSLMGKNWNTQDISGTPFQLALSIIFADQIRDIIEAGTLTDIVENFVRGSLQGPASNEDIKKAAQLISTALGLAFIQFSLFQIASTLNLAGLIPQIFGNLDSHPDLISALRASVNIGIAEVLMSSVSLALLEATLTDRLVTHFDADKSSAEFLVRGALQNAIGTTPYLSDFEFRIGLVRGFQSAGLDQKTAEDLADTALAFIENEKEKLSLIRNGAPSDVIAQALSAYAAFGIVNIPDAAPSTIPPGSIDTTLIRREPLEEAIFGILAGRGYDRIEAQAIIDAAINTVFLVPYYASEAAFRENLKIALVNAGASPEDAIYLSTKAVISIRSHEVPELFSTSLASILSVEQLRAAVAEEVVAKLAPAIGLEEAQKLTNQLIELLFGKTADQGSQTLPIVRLLDSQLALWIALSDGKHQDKLADNMREYLRPMVDLFALNQRIMDPANTLILSMLTGVMYSGDLPANFQKTVDFLI